MIPKKPSRSEPVTELKKVPIVECGEPLVNFLEVSPELLFDRPRFTYRRELLARKSLAEKLGVAARNLPEGYKLAAIECWRAPIIQQRMYKAVWNRFHERNPQWSESHLRRVVNQFTAPMNFRVPPPHTTGGAVDLMLIGPSGERCDLQSPLDRFDARGYFFDSPVISAKARANRDLMAEALLSAGLTNYPSEYWHWSYGDQGWAYRGAHPNAIYAAITPDAWSADPADDIDGPLEMVEYED
jgi:D-alanyl-D-alanine dipeptidase